MARRTLARLTSREVVKLSKQPGRYADGGGLYLQVSPAGVPSWVFRYRVDGRERYAGLGPLHAVTLASARQKAANFRAMRFEEQPRDPLAERQAGRLADKLARAKVMSFRECAREYIAAKKEGWRNPKHRAQWSATLERYAFPLIGDLPVETVDTALVMQVLLPIWATKPETASRVRGRIEAVIDWATVSEFRQGDNPARWRGHLEHKLAAKAKVRRVEHHAALRYVELPGFMAELRTMDGLAARALEFTILTVARTGEVIGARWAEFDMANRVWTVPAERMKAGKEHRVALGAAVIEILQGLKATGDRPFPLSNMAMSMLLRRMGRDVTVHGFRSCFSDWAAEQTNAPSEVREMALAHTVSDKVEAAYRRGDLFDKRRALAAQWESYCIGNTDDKVVPLRRAAE